MNRNVFSKEELKWFTNEPEKISKNKQNKNPKNFDKIRQKQIKFEQKSSGYPKTKVEEMYFQKGKINMRI